MHIELQIFLQELLYGAKQFFLSVIRTISKNNLFRIKETTKLIPMIMNLPNIKNNDTITIYALITARKIQGIADIGITTRDLYDIAHKYLQ